MHSGQNNWIQRISMGTGEYSLGVQAAHRIIIRVSADTRVAYDPGLLDSVYFTIPSGTIIVLDPPNFIEVLWCKLDSASSGVIEAWITG